MVECWIFFFDSTMFLNLQIWLYQGTNDIEVRYGTSHVNLDKSQVFGCGPLVGLAKVDTVKRIDLYELYLRGAEHNPTTIGLNDTGKRCLNNVPVPGIIYRFTYHDQLGIAPQMHSGFSIFPNPTKGNLNINLAENSPSVLQVTDVSARIVINTEINKSCTEDLSQIPDGVYIAKLAQKGSVYVQKLVVNK